MDPTLTWILIGLCLTHSAMFSGLNLAYFAVGRLELEFQAKKGDRNAEKVLHLRKDSNFLLVTILWGNVGINVLLALLSGSVMAGVAAFLFSTVVITIFGEIIPQAYFSRHALRVGALLSPVLRFWQIVLYPLARSTGLILDRWLGPEAIPYMRERDLKHLIQLHADAAETEISRVEGTGALNFFTLDDQPLATEGDEVDPESVIQVDFENGRPVFPMLRTDREDPFLRKVHSSGKRWVVLVDRDDEPRLVMDSDEFIREAVFDPDGFRPLIHCHRPIMVREARTRLGSVLPSFEARPGGSEGEVVDRDIILVWDEEGHRRVITGADILGRLLRGIARPEARGAGAVTSPAGTSGPLDL
jgi:metal transporter CNNM